MNQLLFPLLISAALGLSACETSDATEAVLENGYPGGVADLVDSPTVYKGWWSVAEFRAPVEASEVSDPVRVVAGKDYAYALLAPGWDPLSGSTPERLIPVRTTDKLAVARGDTLRVVISDDTTLGNCAGSSPLEQADADFITQRIFPGEFSSQMYDAKTCMTSALSAAGAPGL